MARLEESQTNFNVWSVDKAVQSQYSLVFQLEDSHHPLPAVDIEAHLGLMSTSVNPGPSTFGPRPLTSTARDHSATSTMPHFAHFGCAASPLSHDPHINFFTRRELPNSHRTISTRYACVRRWIPTTTRRISSVSKRDLSPLF